MSTPFKMKGWSPFTQKTGKGPIMPKDHPVTLPTEEQSKKSKGTLKNIGPETRNLSLFSRLKGKFTRAAKVYKFFANK